MQIWFRQEKEYIVDVCCELHSIVSNNLHYYHNEQQAH